MFYFVGGFLKFETIPELFGYHIEGDTRVIFHTKDADTKSTVNIKIQGNVTYILINLL